MIEEFIVIEGNKHRVGDSDCNSGWCGIEYPKKCKKCGKGLVHAEFGDENMECDYWLFTKCDFCGEPE